MILEIIILVLLAIIIGATFTYPLRKKIKGAEERRISKILKNPEELVERLNQNGVMVDFGEELKYGIQEVQGRKIVILEKFPINKTDELNQNNEQTKAAQESKNDEEKRLR